MALAEVLRQRALRLVGHESPFGIFYFSIFLIVFNYFLSLRSSNYPGSFQSLPLITKLNNNSYLSFLPTTFVASFLSPRLPSFKVQSYFPSFLPSLLPSETGGLERGPPFPFTG